MCACDVSDQIIFALSGVLVTAVRLYVLSVCSVLCVFTNSTRGMKEDGKKVEREGERERERERGL